MIEENQPTLSFPYGFDDRIAGEAEMDEIGQPELRDVIRIYGVAET